LIKKLEVQANKQGGKLHLLLGNHERLILDGITQHVDIKYRAICDKLLINYNQLYGSDTYCFYFYNYQDELVWEGCFYCYWELEPGEYETMIWDQKNMQGEQVPGGTYKVKGEFNIDDELYSDTSTFYILESGRFCGYVYAPDGQTPLEKAVIYVDAVDCFWETDENGYYETGNHWMPGWWDITACPPHEHPEALMCSFKIAHIERGETCWVNFTLENKKENTPPQNMEINGPTSCKIGTEYEYIFTAKIQKTIRYISQFTGMMEIFQVFIQPMMKKK